MNEIQQHRIAKQYKDYYSFYNKAIRPMEEKRPVQVVQGTVTWKETHVDTGITDIKVVR